MNETCSTKDVKIQSLVYQIKLGNLVKVGGYVFYFNKFFRFFFTLNKVGNCALIVVSSSIYCTCQQQTVQNYPVKDFGLNEKDDPKIESASLEPTIEILSRLLVCILNENYKLQTTLQNKYFLLSPFIQDIAELGWVWAQTGHTEGQSPQGWHILSLIPIIELILFIRCYSSGRNVSFIIYPCLCCDAPKSGSFLGHVMGTILTIRNSKGGILT